ncbi:MAG: hypothetical protein P1V18_02075 [Candidatus Gracilibacteria bacterium]|nr:hypothetical protein [Candidatus Gracilibacteria bacterium]
METTSEHIGFLLTFKGRMQHIGGPILAVLLGIIFLIPLVSVTLIGSNCEFDSGNASSFKERLISLQSMFGGSFSE